jgi:hypothetical protein
MCHYLNNIYLEHIHPNLVGEELKYSRLIIEEILDIWNSCTEKKSISHPNIIEYYNHGIECFRLYIDDDRLHIFDEVYDPLYDKYCYHIVMLDMFEFVMQNHTNLGKYIWCT